MLGSGGSKNLGAKSKNLRGVFNRSRHLGYLKNHRKCQTHIHRMTCVLHTLLVETICTYGNNILSLEVLLITECCFTTWEIFSAHHQQTFAVQIVMFQLSKCPRLCHTQAKTYCSTCYNSCVLKWPFCTFQCGE